MDVEHTKALAGKFDPAAPSQYLAKLGREVVAAVERVQALHTPINAADYGVRNRGAITQVCTGCGQDDGNWQYWPCPTIRALETP